MTVDFETLFERIGKSVYIATIVEDSYKDDVSVEMEAFLDSLDSETQDFQLEVKGNLDDQVEAYGSSTAQYMNTLCANPLQRLVTRMMDDDSELYSRSFSVAMQALHDEMVLNSETVDASTVTSTVAYGDEDEDGSSSSGQTSNNYGDGVIVVSHKREDGRVQEFVLTEEMTAAVTSVTSSTATWKFLGKPSKPAIGFEWPGGSSVSKSVVAYNASSSLNLVTTGDFETDDTNADYLPSGWVLGTGTLGTTVGLTDSEVQAIAISGTPTGGHYILTYVDADGDEHHTVPLTYNASESAVQAALRSLPELSLVEVTTTGTSPNYTHTITMTGVPNPAQISYESHLTGGTPVITPTTPTPGSAYTVRGSRCLEFDGNGSEQTALLVPVSVSALKQYAMCVFLSVDTTPASGELTIELVDGVGGSVVSDDAGTANQLAVDLTGLDSTILAHSIAFRTPSVLPSRVYLRLRLSTALSNTTSLFVDELSLREMTKLYTGGVFAAAFMGQTQWEVGDEARIQVTNNREGQLHEWLNRLLGLRSKEILLPTATVGTRPDSLIT